MSDLCPRAESVGPCRAHVPGVLVIRPLKQRGSQGKIASGMRTTTSQYIELTPLWQPLGADDMHLAECTEFRAWAITIIGCMTQSVDVNDLCTVHYLDLVFCSSTSLSSLRRTGRHFIVEGSIKTY